MPYGRQYNSTVVRYFFVGLVLLITLIIVVYVMLPALKPRWKKCNDEDVDDVLREEQALSEEQKKRLFDADFVDDDNETNKNALPDAGLLVPVNCDYKPTICLNDSNCALLCQNASVKHYQCDMQKHVCVDHGLPMDIKGSDGYFYNGEKDSISSENCNTRLGEYALLQGYNEIGIAVWNCVGLYPGWNDYSRYCEGGIVELDMRHRLPSYRDCTCPQGTTRMVYRQSMLGQEMNGLPHCVKFPHLYELDYVIV